MDSGLCPGKHILPYETPHWSSSTWMTSLPCAHLRQLSNHSVAFAAHQLLDDGIAKDDVGVLAYLHSAVRVKQVLQPTVSG